MTAIVQLTRSVHRPAQTMLVLALCIAAPMALSLGLATIGYGAA
jgi:hypothetical protein